MMMKMMLMMMMMTMSRCMQGNLKGDNHVQQAHVASGFVWVKAHEAQGSHLHDDHDDDDNDDHDDNDDTHYSL